MSKITQEKKTPKGKQKKIAEADAKKTTKSKDEASKQGKSNIPNLNKCCTCTHYPAHFQGEAQPCKIKGTYVARKCDACASYKCKIG